METETVNTLLTKALFNLLEDHEGVAIKLNEEWYQVYRWGEDIQISEFANYVDFKDKLKNGDMLYLHDQTIH